MSNIQEVNISMSIQWCIVYMWHNQLAHWCTKEQFNTCVLYRHSEWWYMLNYSSVYIMIEWTHSGNEGWVTWLSRLLCVCVCVWCMCTCVCVCVVYVCDYVWGVMRSNKHTYTNIFSWWIVKVTRRRGEFRTTTLISTSTVRGEIWHIE